MPRDEVAVFSFSSVLQRGPSEPLPAVSQRRPAIIAQAWPLFAKTVIQLPAPGVPQTSKPVESSGLESKPPPCRAKLTAPEHRSRSR